MSENRRRFFRRRTEKRTVFDDLMNFFGLQYSSGSTQIKTSSAMQLSAVYRCVEVISDALGSMPIDIVRFTTNAGVTVDRGHTAFNMLNLEPNLAMSRFTFMKTLVTHMLLNGNGYAEIIRDKSGVATQLDLINDTVTVYKSATGGLKYKVTKQDEGVDDDGRWIDGQNMIHVLNFTYNGMIGVSTLTHATMTTSVSMASEKQAKGFFSGGANAGGILQTTGKITPEKAAAMKLAWGAAFETEDGTPNGVAVIEAGTTFTPVSVNPKDAQMLESRQYNTQEICRFFGVNPQKAFDTTAASYNSVEAGQLAFLTDAVAPVAAKIENEFNRKLFLPSERSSVRTRFDTNELLRIDSDSQANYMQKMFQIGAFTPNEIRERIGNELVEGGDVPYVQVNMQPLTTATTKENEGDKEPVK